MFLFADDAALNGLYLALTALCVVLTTAVQTWWQDKRARKAAERLAVKADDAAGASAKAAAKADIAANVAAHAAAKVAEKVDASVSAVKQDLSEVKESLNGKGIGGALQRIEEWAKAHDVKDDTRHEELTGRMAALEKRK